MLSSFTDLLVHTTRWAASSPSAIVLTASHTRPYFLFAGFVPPRGTSFAYPNPSQTSADTTVNHCDALGLP